ncbi:hypothetical protein UA08_01314 [Talaromyces atroroseus]|uniref:Uncharacterized protein n=1 Tax=Talaromyces atroroseus TaxID=1441469 RepID=A0A1Q5QB97_TALAT|nr:hypothetical protein UA08_01314 [Talaromyces atroroseus]OKL63213.1 hypothetical protein UA08_01314 [Talaromyces atroroseus]
MPLSIRLVPQPIELRSMAHAMAEATRIEEAEAEAARSNNNRQGMSPGDDDDEDDDEDDDTTEFNDTHVYSVQELIPNLHREESITPVSRFDSNSSSERHIEEVENVDVGVGAENSGSGHTSLKAKTRGWKNRVSGLRMRCRIRMKKMVRSMKSGRTVVGIVEWWKRRR